MLLVMNALALFFTAQQDSLVSNAQSHIVYECIARLDTDFQVLEAAITISYVNTSQLAIDTIYLNTYAYIDIDQVILGKDIGILVDERGILSVPLHQPLEQGDSCEFTIVYEIDIPVHNGIFGYLPGHYEMTRWYPRVCPHDVQGWFLGGHEQHLGQYAPFASYDIRITLPDEYIVAATGIQVDPAENEFMERYIARGERIRYGGEKTVHFIAPQVRDFIWACDLYFIVQEHTVNDINVRFFYRPYDIYTWEKAVIYSADMISRYTDWFGPLSCERMNIVQGVCRSSMHFPQVVFVNSSEDPLTRLFEAGFASDISSQWFSSTVGINEIEETWFSNGLATYASIRYLEDKYGKDHSLIKSSFVPSLSLRYFHRANYYVMRTNELERPMSTPYHEYENEVFTQTNSLQSKPALFFSSLEAYFGTDEFTGIVRDYMSLYRGRTTKALDLFRTIEARTGESMDRLHGSLAYTTDECDWKITHVTNNSVVVANSGNLPIPATVVVESDSGTHVYQVRGYEKNHMISIPEEAGEIVSVAIDPTESLLDINYWNNFHPRKVKVRPITSFELPSFSTYYLYWLPYPWYDANDGVTANFYWFGDRFADFDFIRGGHQFMGGINYGFGSKRAYLSVNYQTPIVFRRGTRIRVALSGSHSKSRDEFSVGLLSGLGIPLTQSPSTTVENKILYTNVYSFENVDSIDWSLGRNVAMSNKLRYTHAGWDMALELSLALHGAGSDYEYVRTTGQIQRTLSFLVPCRVRLFAGKVFGEAPVHERLFLCGDLRINWFADLFFSQSGSMSPQEHIHIPGYGSMRGYQTFHFKSDQLFAMNLECPATSFIRVFADIGYYDELAFDAGISLAISAETISSLPVSGIGLSANFPLYTYTDQPWKLRWSIGFSM
jgi:hypothetical protein